MEEKASDKADGQTEDQIEHKTEDKAGDTTGAVEVTPGEAPAVPEPVSELLSNSITETDSNVAVEPVVQTVAHPVAESATQPVAVSATQPVADVGKPKSSKRRLKNDLSIFDLATGVLLLVIMSLLVANSYIAYLGKSYNERICAESIALAAKAANDGLDTPHVQMAALESWGHSVAGGFFIEQPILTGFWDDIKPNLRVITISSSTKVRMPAAILILDKSNLDQDGEPFAHITFKNTYQYRLTNPKIAPGSKIRTRNGGTIKMPGALPKANPSAPK